MEKRILQTSPNPHIYLETDGDLTVKGDPTDEIIVRAGSPESVQVDVQGDQVRIICKEDLTLRVPRGAQVEAGRVLGSASFKIIEGNISIGQVHGDLLLKDTGPVEVDQVLGELMARQIDGNLEIGGVNGSARVSEVQGDVVFQKTINGSLKLENVDGDIRAHANGNIALSLDPRAGQSIQLKADGNVLCRFAEDSSISIEVLRAAEVKVILPEMKTKVEETPYEYTLGEGDADLTIRASGNVLLTLQAPEWGFGPAERDFQHLNEDIGEQVAAHLEQQMQHMETQFEAQLDNLAFRLEGSGLSPEAAERLSRKAREASARATARAQEKMKKAQEKIQRRLEAAQRRAEAKSRAAERRSTPRERRSWGFEWPSPPASPAQDPVSEAERLMILKMLEENKITPEEADRLLDALEGK
jgi:hypothetical protein